MAKLKGNVYQIGCSCWVKYPTIQEIYATEDAWARLNELQ